MRMITKASIALLATAAVAATGAPTASAATTCVVMDIWAGVCVDHNTDDPSVQVSCQAFDNKYQCSLRRLP